ncbi:ferritin-like domain-containing protein [Actinoplanes sp. DH11]|uniref:ferritin-like domain-containing protein n=1 Tax=Actinoplanes sp. DH11 TaxID=2857011 RepID=UPI001E5E24AF|nr:ferritin-like domain-containing protein [Actinoplanes sp. DH11]
MNEQLAGALAAEEAAIYAYGLIGVHLTRVSEVSGARDSEQEHRRRRDYLVDRLDELKTGAPPAPAGYRLPFEVTNRASALKLAVHVEDGVAQAWRAVLPVTEKNARNDALSAMTDSAVRATAWRRFAGITPLTMAFPGRPS